MELQLDLLPHAYYNTLGFDPKLSLTLTTRSLTDLSALCMTDKVENLPHQ